jgi:hypothetical protein
MCGNDIKKHEKIKIKLNRRNIWHHPVQNVSCSHLLCKTLRIKIHITKIIIQM